MALPAGASPPFLLPSAPRKRAACSTSVTPIGITVIAKHRHHESHRHFLCPLPWQLRALINTLCLPYLLSYPCCCKEGWATSLGGNGEGSHQEAARPGSPGDPVVKNPPANAGDMGSIPAPGRSHMPQSNKARAPQLLSPRVKSPCSAKREAAAMRSPCAGTGG